MARLSSGKSEEGARAVPAQLGLRTLKQGSFRGFMPTFPPRTPVETQRF